MRSNFRSDTDPEAKAETDSQFAQIHEMLLLEKLASYLPVTENEPNCALEEIPEKLCDNDLTQSSAIIVKNLDFQSQTMVSLLHFVA